MRFIRLEFDPSPTDAGGGETGQRAGGEHGLATGIGLAATLDGARMTARTTRLIARRLKMQEIRDTLLLWAVALEAVVERVEREIDSLDAAERSAAMAELDELIGQLEDGSAVMMH
jgi:hypothetical protein